VTASGTGGRPASGPAPAASGQVRRGLAAAASPAAGPAQPGTDPAAVYPFGRAPASFFLGGATAADLPEAQPLLAYGANGSPERLAAKLPGVAVAALAATLHGWAIVHSAHVSPYGQVPATLVEAPGERAAVHVLFVADRAPLDATEPNYDLRRLTGLRLEVDRLGALDAVDAYLSKWGALLIDGAHVPLGALPQETLLRAVRST
jgi:hypothetical protein